MLSKCLGLTVNDLCHLLRIAVPTQRSRNSSISRPLRMYSNAQEITKFNIGPNVLKAHVIELFSSRQELWLRMSRLPMSRKRILWHFKVGKEAKLT